MGIQIREAMSDEMKKNIRTVKKMTKGMGFDENMGKIRLGNTEALISEYGKTDDKNMCSNASNFGYE